MNIEEIDEIKTNILEKLDQVRCDEIVCSECPLGTNDSNVCGIRVINRMWS